MSLLHTPTDKHILANAGAISSTHGAQNGNIHLASSSAAIRIFLREWRAK